MESKIDEEWVRCYKCKIILSKTTALPCYYPESVINYFSCNNCQEECYICMRNLSQFNKLQCKYNHICCADCVQKIAAIKKISNCKWNDVFKCHICENILSKRESHSDMQISIIMQNGKKYVEIPDEIREEKATYWIGSAINPRRDYGHAYGKLKNGKFVLFAGDINVPDHYFTIAKFNWIHSHYVIYTYGLFLL